MRDRTSHRFRSGLRSAHHPPAPRQPASSSQLESTPVGMMRATSYFRFALDFTRRCWSVPTGDTLSPMGPVGDRFTSILPTVLVDSAHPYALIYAARRQWLRGAHCCIRSRDAAGAPHDGYLGPVLRSCCRPVSSSRQKSQTSSATGRAPVVAPQLFVRGRTV
jgi:hypothetical protein